MEHQNRFLRGKNYTSEDRSLFLSLVEAKKGIIECRISNRVSLEAKREAWLDITRKYNAGSTVYRSLRQLKTFYENLKRKTKKEVATENKEKYKDLLSAGLESLEEVDKILIEDLKDRARLEKKEIHRTGGGTFNTTLTDGHYRVLSLLGDNIRPLDNEFDDANLYFANPTPSIQEVDPIPHQEVVDPTPQECFPSLPPSNDKIPPRKRTLTRSKKNNIKRKNVLSPKDRYYLQKLANAKVEGQILRLQLRKLKET